MPHIHRRKNPKRKENVDEGEGVQIPTHNEYPNVLNKSK
jgi:hypothetical protein